MADIIDLELNSTAHREIINENFRKLNEEEGGGIPAYDEVPSEKYEDMIYVYNIGFMEWDTSVSPNQYTKNIVLVEEDLKKLILAPSMFPPLTPGAYPIAIDSRVYNRGESSKTISVNRKGTVRYVYTVNSSVNVNVTIYKNGIAVYSGARPTGSYTHSMAVEAGDKIHMTGITGGSIAMSFSGIVVGVDINSLQLGAVGILWG